MLSPIMHLFKQVFAEDVSRIAGPQLIFPLPISDIFSFPDLRAANCCQLFRYLP